MTVTHLGPKYALSKKNKSISKGKTGGKKKTVDPFAKDWYDIKAPSVFSVRNIGKTLVSRTQGTKIASEGLQHRVFEVCLADLQNDEDQAHRKIRLRAEDVQGKNGQSKMTAFNIFCVKVDRPAEDVQMEGEEVAGALAYRWVWRTVLGT